MQSSAFKSCAYYNLTFTMNLSFTDDVRHQVWPCYVFTICQDGRDGRRTTRKRHIKEKDQCRTKRWRSLICFSYSSVVCIFFIISGKIFQKLKIFSVKKRCSISVIRTPLKQLTRAEELQKNYCELLKYNLKLGRLNCECVYLVSNFPENQFNWQMASFETAS